MAGPQFQDHVAIVTGAAGGIGSAVVRRLLGEGARVALVDINRSELEAMAEQLGKDAGRVLAAPADVTREADVADYVRRTVDHFGRADLFFNNAGVEARIATIADTDPAEFDRVMAVNMRGVFLGLREVLRVLQRQGSGGAIVNTASIAAYKGAAGAAAYTASKHAVIGLTRVAALEGAEFGVRVNAIAPGYIDTPMLRAINEARSPGNPQAARDVLTSRIPLHRYGHPDEVANLVIWLLSAEASYVTGSTHLVDAGVMA
jgi:NAD(P)-dependent dehydrogenase (short-subunit alcohol dehydrogenase family)